MKRSLALLLVALLFWSTVSVPEKPLRVTYPKSLSGETYTFFYQDDLQIKFTTTRPLKEDQNVLISIAAAFTTLDKGAVDGIYMVDGKVGNQRAVSRGVGGAVIIKNGKCEILNSDKGKLFTDSLINSLKKAKASCFQQIMIIENGKAASFKDKAIFQRRAVVTAKNGKCFIAESSSPITLKKFSEELVELGAWNAIYTDMGGWDEGWYRDEKNSPVTIGKILSSTNKQCNWVTFSRTPKKK